MIWLTPTTTQTTKIPKIKMIMIPIPKIMAMMMLTPMTHNPSQEWNTTTTIKLTKKTTQTRNQMTKSARMILTINPTT